MTAATHGFTGFRPTAFTFFRGLRDNNDPAWFKPRKGVYEAEVLAPFRALVNAVGAAFSEAGIPLAGDPMRSIFRIYRDVRFSPDKRLYKTHAGAVLTRSGGKRDPGLLYLHLEPGESDRKSTRLNSSHVEISYAVFCLKKKKLHTGHQRVRVILHNPAAVCPSLTLEPHYSVIAVCAGS